LKFRVVDRIIAVATSRPMQRFLIITGLAMLVLGAAWPWLVRSGWWRWLGRLPGDLHIEREGFSFHFPLMTSILVSILLTLLLWLFRK
jgi:hypothetical protein